MEENEMVQRTISYVQQTLQHSEKGHDWLHILRVYRQANFIANYEPGNKLVVALGALLHDIADSKFHGGDESLGPQQARRFLSDLGLPDVLVDQVVFIVKNISFSSGLSGIKTSSPELDIVQDADRLDALGAIGIARAFHYGGYKNREIYNPDIPPVSGLSGEAYKNNSGPTLNHFYEKLLLLKDKMNTPTGKKMAQPRHDFLENYLSQFYKEWNEYHILSDFPA